MTGAPEISIISIARNEAANLPVLHQRLAPVMDTLGMAWEWIVVDDHSDDGTFAVIAGLAAADPRIRGLRFSRHFGSHAATVCGLHHARGACAVLMASDLQDPPELIPTLVAPWRDGAHIVSATRSSRPGESFSTVLFSRLYHGLMRSILRQGDAPVSGTTYRLLDRRVIDAVRRFGETPSGLHTLLTWMGYRAVYVPYDQPPRLHGRSQWTLGQKVKLVIDSVTSFSYLPIRIITVTGFLTAVLGFAYAVHVIGQAIAGGTVEGWASLMVVVLVLAGVQMIMLGVLGEYLWRSLAESRRRPQYLIEDDVGLTREPPP